MRALVLCALLLVALVSCDFVKKETEQPQLAQSTVKKVSQIMDDSETESDSDDSDDSDSDMEVDTLDTSSDDESDSDSDSDE